jgi:hypothetical protein
MSLMLNHYETVKQIKVLGARQTLDSLYFNVLVLSQSYKNFFKIEECVREAQRTISYDLDKFHPLSTDIHNLLAGMLSVKPKTVEDEVLLNSTALNLKRFVSFIRRIANKQAYNEQMDYYIKELRESLVIRDQGLIALGDMVINFDQLDDEQKLVLFNGIVNYGMKYARNNHFVQSYVEYHEELEREMEYARVDREIEENAIARNQEDSIQMEILNILRDDRNDRLQREEQERLDQEEEERQAIEEYNKAAREQFTTAEYLLTGVGAWKLGQKGKINHNGESGSNPSTSMFSSFVDKYKDKW